jgi:ribose 5-phosphate isomerase RpiB
MKTIYTIVTIILFSSCNTYRPSRHVKIADKITAEVAKKIEKETNLHLCGTGGGMMNEIRMMAMSFDYCNELTIEQARELLVY